MSPTGGLSSKAGSVASSNAAAPPKALRSPLPANAAVLPDMDSIPENRVSHYSYSVASSTLSISELQPPKAVSKKLIRCHQRKSEYIDPESAFGLRTRRFVGYISHYYFQRFWIHFYFYCAGDCAMILKS
jgi:hypothetical protein